jgi:serine/threonine protein kinase
MSSGGSAPGPASRFDRVNSIVEAAAELRPEERAPFVEGLCGGDPEMRDSVLRLLSVFGRMGDFMEKRARRGAELRAGDVLAGRFRIVEKLGEGGMGSVYLAEDRELGEVALKTIRADLRENAEVIERFRSEIKLARGIGHRNVCPVFELFPNEETAAGPVTFFTMKYLKGETLANRLARGRMELDEALRVARGIAAGLDALHSDGIVHRDLKPGNVILTPEPDGPDRPVITDFGLARTASGAADGAVTGAARLMGSPDYMAPEQFLNATVGKAADVYAFGSIVFEMAAGARPFPKEDLLHAAVRRASEDAPRLSSVAKGVPGWLDAAVARSLRREVGERAGSAGEVVRGPVERGVSRRTLVGAAGGAIVLSGIYAARRYMDRAVPLPESPKMMLTACAHLPGEKDREIAATVDTLLRTQLQQSAHVSLLDAGSVERALGRMQAGSGQKKSLDDAKTAREAAMREGAAYVLFGDLGRKADVYNVGLRLELLGASPEREREHWDFEASAREDELRELPARIDRAVYEIRRKVGESQKDWEVHNRTPSELTTGSWEALQLYVRGEESWAAARRVEAVDFVKAAIDLDAEFILALGRLAD